jgi:translation initiation factor 1A
MTGEHVDTVVTEETSRKNLRMPHGDEQFAVVTRHDGGNHVQVRCQDGTQRLGRIPGRMKYRVWIEEGDVVLVEPWDWQDEKADIEWRYSEQDADQLREEGHIE